MHSMEVKFIDAMLKEMWISMNKGLGNIDYV